MLVNQFDCILFDVDETLFEFDAYQGLRQVFAQYHVDFTLGDYHTYQSVNKPLWVAYQQQEITAEQLKVQRFAHWAERITVPASTLNQQFLQAMALTCRPLAGAQSLLEQLAPKVRLGIITNGFVDLLHARLNSTGFDRYFQVLTVSEQFGVAKPAPAIFHHTLAQLPGSSAARTLMVGDTPESDIAGGINAGMKTCWLDNGDKSLPAELLPDWRVNSLAELQQLLLTEES